MTSTAGEFVGARTFQALTGEAVLAAWSDDRTGMDHIDLARWADRILIAPATADFLARLAHGRANDLLSALCLASTAPLLVAPAMNQAMWRNPATQDNVALLKQRQIHILGPAHGEQACGDVGPGRMLEPAVLVDSVSQTFANGLLAGLRLLVTAGPTREPLDPVRYLSNRSSGKMGYAVAAAARQAGASVALISGPVSLQPPEGVECIQVESAQAMHDTVMARVAECDIFIAAAAVADYCPADRAPRKIKKQAADWSLPLVPAPDILGGVAGTEPRPFCVGFAAETDDLEKNAQKKRLRKGVDLIAANQVGDGQGFDSDDNALLLIWEGGKTQLKRDSKTRLAMRLIEHIARLYNEPDHKASTEPHAKHSA
jgi:phosphopantothenoylcysteine decarboxylase/phosphopantothenate--cysteine ligase